MNLLETGIIIIVALYVKMVYVIIIVWLKGNLVAIIENLQINVMVTYALILREGNNEME